MILYHCLTFSLNKYWSPFVQRCFYIKPKVKCMHCSDHIEEYKNKRVITRAQKAIAL